MFFAYIINCPQEESDLPTEPCSVVDDEIVVDREESVTTGNNSRIQNVNQGPHQGRCRAGAAMRPAG